MEMGAMKFSEIQDGCQVSLVTDLGDQIEGEVLAFDEDSKTLILQDIGSIGPRRNLRLVRVSHVKSFTVIGQSEGATDFEICTPDDRLLQEREETAVRQATADAERIGVGVSEEAQNIFNSLSKTLPVRWDKSTIIVMDDIRVTSPHMSENVMGGTPEANGRVKTLLEFYWKKIQDKC